VAVNVPSEEVAALNPELLRGVTPPDAPSYTLNLPPNSKDLFTKNITIARIEHPAVASHPIRTAGSSGPSYSGRRSSSHQAAVAQKSSGPSRASAKSPKKSAGRTYAKKETPVHSAPVKAGAAPVVQASLFGTPTPASKHGDTKKTKVALIGASKSKTKTPAVQGKKAAETRLAKKSDCSPKSPAKAKKTSPPNKNSKDKDKYSRSKSTRTIMVSEAR
jgi:hypothetical protein